MSRTLLLRNGRVLVGDEESTRMASIAVADGRIVAIGPDDRIARTLSHVDEEIELHGRAVFPGFVDGHCHLELTAIAFTNHLRVHSPPFGSIAEILSTLSQARAHQPEGWLIARGSFGLQNKVIERRLPQRDELDRVSPGRPLAVLAGLHVASLNTAAIEELGLTEPSRLPEWITVHRDANGVPNGVFTEVWDRLPTASVADVVSALRTHAAAQFSSRGITSLSTIPTSANDVRALHRLAQSEELPLRVRYFVHVPRTATLDEVLAWGPESGFGDDRLRFGGVKIFVNGEGGDGLGTPRDDTKWTRPELFNLVRRADQAGIQLMMHAVTPAAIRFACEAVLHARALNSGSGVVRHRIEHAADYMDPRDAHLAARAQVGLVATPHFVEDGDENTQPLRALIDAGHGIIGASDSTGTVPDAIAPLTNIGAAAARRNHDGTASPHRITAREGIRMFTRWSAHSVGEEKIKGAITPGFLADLVILDADPLDVPVDRIASIRVERTIVGGRTVFGAES